MSYISREAAIKALVELFNQQKKDEYKEAIAMALAEIAQVPVAIQECEACKKILHTNMEYPEFSFCPNCGADMRGKT